MLVKSPFIILTRFFFIITVLASLKAAVFFFIYEILVYPQGGVFSSRSPRVEKPFFGLLDFY